MASDKLELTIIKADGSIEETSVDQESIILGSGASANVQLDDDKVSSIHAMLKIEGPGKVRVIDLGSESGTRLKGKEIREHDLENGDVIEIGRCKVRVKFAGAEEPDDAQKTDVIQRPPDFGGDDDEPTGEMQTEPVHEAKPAKKAEKIEAKPKKKAAPPPPPEAEDDDDELLDEDDLDEELARADRDRDEVEASKPEPEPEPEPKVAAKPARPVPPPPAPAGPAKATGVRQTTDVIRALHPERPTSAARLFSEVLPPEERPQHDSRMLEVVMVWSDTIIGIGHYTGADKLVTMGDGPRNDFHLASDVIPDPRFQFLAATGEDWTLTISEGMELMVRDDAGNVEDLEQLKTNGRAKRTQAEFRGYDFKMGLHDQAVVHIGDTAFVIRFVRPSKRIVTNVWDTVDFYFTKVLSTSFMAHILFVAALLLTPINTQQLSEDLFKNPNRFAKLIIKPPEKKAHKKFRDLSGVAEGAKAKKEEGKFGKKEAVKKHAAPAKKGAPIVDVNKREEDRKKVMSSGLLAALNSPDRGAASNVFGPGGLGTGINNALGGLQGGAGMGDAHGVGGLGSRGTGPGGGGTALGIGGLGTKGGGRGRGGYGSIDLGGRGKSTTRITPGKTIVQGGLAKEVIARIVHRHQNEIKYCYERELQKDPNLYGKVAVLWVIDPTGSVAQASIAQSTMGNANVENCILTRVRRWKFPQPKGGGIVQVTYPWIFKPSG